MAGKKAKYGVELENKFSKPATGVVKSVDQMRSSSLRAGSAIKAMANDMVHATREARRLKAATFKMGKGPLAAKSGFEKNRGKMTDWKTQAVFARKSANGLTTSLNQLGGSAGVAGKGLGGLSVKGLAAKGAIGALVIVALKAAQVLARLGMQFGRAVMGAVDFLQRSRMAFGLLVKGAGKSQAALRNIINVAGDLGLPIQETVKQYQKLLAMQFTPKAATSIIKMSADLKALGADTEEVGRVILAMTQIKAKGRVQAEELLQLSEAGVSTELVLGALSKKLGKTTQEVRKLMQAGKITAEDGLAAIGEAIKKKAHITEFGEAAKKASTTLSGMAARLKGGLMKALFAIADRALPMIEKVAKPIFDDLMGMMSGGAGGQMFDVLAGGVKFFVGLVQRAWPIVKGFATGFAEGFAVALPAIKFLGKSILSVLGPNGVGGLVIIFQTLGRVLGFVAGYLALVVTALAKLLTMASLVYGTVAQVTAAAWDLGAALVEGIAAGVKAGALAVIKAVIATAGDAVQAAKQILGINSPSKVFAKMGLQTAEGFALGVGDGAKAPQAAMNAMTAPPPAAGSLAGGGGTNVGGVSIAIDTGGAIAAAQTTDDPVAYAAAVMHMIRDQLAEELSDALAQLGLEG